MYMYIFIYMIPDENDCSMADFRTYPASYSNIIITLLPEDIMTVILRATIACNRSNGETDLGAAVQSTDSMFV